MRVAVLGAGYAGLTVARRLERSLPDDVELVVVDESGTHLVQHELHRVIRHPKVAETITLDLDRILSRAEVRQATITDLDTEAGTATLLENGETETLSYDFAAVCLGAETEFYDLDGVETYATPLKTLDNAETIRADVLDADGGEVLVGGGGLSGIQAAGEIGALSEERELDLDVTLVEMADRVAPGFDSTFAAAIRSELDARGITVETGVAVESADEGTVHLADGRSIPFDAFVWAGGIRGPAALAGERRATPRDLRVSDSTFVVGDAALVTDENGTQVPASAQTAVRQARTAAANIDQLVRGKSEHSKRNSVSIPITEDGTQREQREQQTEPENPEPELLVYEPETAGWVVSVGDGAVAQVGPFVFSGEPAKAAKAAIGVGHLGSVGAIRQASELVAEELGWPTASGLGLLEKYEGSSTSSLPTDPASASELGDPLVALLRQFDSAFPADAIDLTGLTRQTDRSYPGSVAGEFGRLLTDSFDGLLEASEDLLGIEESDTEPVSIDIDVGDESDDMAELTDEESEQTGSDEESEQTGEWETDEDEDAAGGADEAQDDGESDDTDESTG